MPISRSVRGSRELISITVTLCGRASPNKRARLCGRNPLTRAASAGGGVWGILSCRLLMLGAKGQVAIGALHTCRGWLPRVMQDGRASVLSGDLTHS